MLDLDFGFAEGILTLLLQAESLVPAKQNRTGISGALGVFSFLFSLSLFPYDDDDDVRRAVLWPVPKT